MASLGATATLVLAVSSAPPASGIDELADALAAHRETVDPAVVRPRSRRRAALDDFAAEHGERGLRALGGRRAAERLLSAEDAARDLPSLVAVLERRAEAGGAG
jgi:LAO/AO transport system kinase